LFPTVTVSNSNTPTLLSPSFTVTSSDYSMAQCPQNCLSWRLNTEKTPHPPPDAKPSHQRRVCFFISGFVLCRRVKTRPSQSWALGRAGEGSPHSSPDSTTLARPRAQFCKGCVLTRPDASIQATADHIKDSHHRPTGGATPWCGIQDACFSAKCNVLMLRRRLNPPKRPSNPQLELQLSTNPPNQPP
jgi:hypothetical protein